jgi:hypothetical protein
MAGTRSKGRLHLRLRLRLRGIADSMSEWGRSTNMTTEQTGMVMVKNAAGDYFVLPQQVLEQGRVPAEHKAEVEQLLASASSGDGEDDVQGHYWQIPIVVGFLAKQLASHEPTAADLQKSWIVKYL